MELKISLLLASYFLLLPFVHAIDASMRYRSPRNPERKVRQSTELIVLHTTEAPARSSLNKVSDRGECHFCVTEEGSVYAIVDRDREAFHAGRSMWRGKEDVDKFSVGIECVGYHDKAMPSVQVVAIRQLVKELQRMYRIPDERVVCHSHVAYGAPNKWHRCKHRGRKRCGMLFAMSSMRQRLGLRSKPAYDPDVRARRLVQADPYLEKVLYGNVDTMRGKAAAAPAAAASSTGGILGWLSGKTAEAESPKPKGEGEKAKAKAKGDGQVPKSKVEGEKAKAKGDGQGPQSKVEGEKAKGQSDSGGTRETKGVASGSGDKTPQVKSNFKTPPASIAELKARGYSKIGCVSKKDTARNIAGDKWNSATTYYTIRDKVIPGNTINPAKIEKGMSVWMKR